MERKENEDGIHLYNAITGGDLELLTRSDSIFLSQTTFQKNTILHIAVQLERKKCVEIILQGLQPSQTWLLLNINRDGDTALHIAAKQGLHEIAELLLNHAKRLGDQDIENGGGNETTLIRQLLSITNDEKNTALHEALLCGALKVVNLVITADTDIVYHANIAGMTPLYLLAEKKLDAAVKQIVSTPASTHYGGPAGKTAMHAAVLRCSLGAIEALHGMSPTMIREADDQGWAPFHYAAYLQERNYNIGHVVLSLDKTVVYSQNKYGMTPLHIAAGKGNDKLVSEIMIECPDCVEVPDHRGRNFLHIAALRGQERVVRCALEQVTANKGFINRLDKDGNTPLHLASIAKSYDVMTLLRQDLRVNIEVRNKGKLTFFDILRKGGVNIQHSSTMVIQFDDINSEDLGEPLTESAPKDDETKMLESELTRIPSMERQESEEGIHLYNAIKGGDLKQLTRSESPLLFKTTCHKNTILHIAVQLERKERVEIILNSLQPSQTRLLLNKNRDGDTALHIAAKQGLHEIAELLLDHAKRLDDQDIENGGGNETVLIRQLLSITNNRKNTALHEALLGCDIRVAELVTTADPNVEYVANIAGKTPLYLAAEEGLNTAVRQIVRTCPSSHYGGPDGKTAMHAAVMKCDSGVIEALHGMSRTMIKQADDQGWTPLHYSAFYDPCNIWESVLTLDKSVVYSQDIGGMTPLHVAAGRGNYLLASKIMVECPEVLDCRGRNFLHMAVFRNQRRVVKCALLEHTIMNKGLINGVDNEGNTPLHLASISKAYSTIVLLCKDARVNKQIRNKKNLTAYDILVEDFKTGDSMSVVAWKALGQLSLEFQLERIRREVLEEPRTKRKHTEYEKKMTELFQRASDSHLVVAALIATVTFAAGFALPGDYNDDGMPNLLKKAAFRAFIISNTIAMLLSSLAVLVHFIIKLNINDREINRIQMLLGTASYTTLGALLAMMLAFVTGTYAVSAKSPGLAVTTCLIGSSFYFTAFILLRPEFRRLYLDFWVLKKLCVRWFNTFLQA